MDRLGRNSVPYMISVIICLGHAGGHDDAAADGTGSNHHVATTATAVRSTSRSSQLDLQQQFLFLFKHQQQKQQLSDYQQQ